METITIETAHAEFDKLLSDRYSCRAFLGKPVPRETIEQILESARRSPSWNNVQPWGVHITTPEVTERLRTALHGGAGADGDFEIAPPAGYKDQYLQRRRDCGWGLYEAVGIKKGDREASARQAQENYRLFGAPHLAVVTTDKVIGPYGLLDCGAWINNFMLAAASLGVATIAQAALALRAPYLREWFSVKDERQIVCGISFGYADTSHPVNGFRTSRAPLTEYVEWVE